MRALIRSVLRIGLHCKNQEAGKMGREARLPLVPFGPLRVLDGLVHLGMEGLAEFLGEAARQLARAHPPPSGASLPQRLEHLRGLLDTLGVATCCEEKEGDRELRLVNSLLPREFSRYPEVYAFPRALAEEILGVPVKLELVSDRGEGNCLLRFGSA